VPEDRLDEVKRLAKAAVEKIKMGDPRDNGVILGPLASTKQAVLLRRLSMLRAA